MSNVIKPIERKSKRYDHNRAMIRCTGCGKLDFRKNMAIIHRTNVTGVCDQCAKPFRGKR